MLKKKITHSIYLIKESYVEDDSYLHDIDKFDPYSVPIAGYPDATVYLKSVISKPHAWSSLLPENTSGIDWKKYRTRSLFGLMLLEVSDRVFAITSGFGRYLLHPFSIEHRFGFKVVLNSINPETINQLSKTTLAENPKTSIEQVSKGVTIGQFGIDGFTDLVQRIKGKSKIEDLGLTLDGEDALKISVPHELDELPRLLDKCLKFYDATDYQKYFSEVDNLAQVKDKEQKSLLNSELEALLNDELDRASQDNNLSGNVWASIPEVIMEDDFDCFTYKRTDKALRFYDIELTDLFRQRYLNRDKSIRKRPTCSSLGNDFLYIRKADGSIFPKWRALNCINALIEKDNEKFFFLEGKWFRASATYIESLDKKISSIKPAGLVFEDWPERVSEKDYLKNLPLTSQADYLILDRDNIYLSGQTPVEPCDIYTKDKKLIHLKRYGSSAFLGHLFNQGFVSGDLLINSIEFKEKFNAKLNDDYKVDEINATDFTIAYVIGTKYPDELNLPLFSKITLTKAFDELRKKGFRVTLDVCRMTQE